MKNWINLEQTDMEEEREGANYKYLEQGKGHHYVSFIH